RRSAAGDAAGATGNVLLSARIATSVRIGDATVASRSSETASATSARAVVAHGVAASVAPLARAAAQVAAGAGTRAAGARGDGAVAGCAAEYGAADPSPSGAAMRS